MQEPLAALRRLCALVLCALAPIGILTGCGGGGSTTTTKHTIPKTTTTSAAVLSARIATAIRRCKREVVAASAYIPAADKATGESDCEGVKTGNVAKVGALRVLLIHACEEKVLAKVPASEQAAPTAACKKAF
jgi:hypothetical protein